MGFWEKITALIKGRWVGLSSDGKKKFVLACTVAAAVLLTISVFISIISTERIREDRHLSGSNDFSIRIPIPIEELFLPDEPDFLPGVLLERERREIWTEDDAQEYWQDPLRFGEEQWRDKIDTAINELLERIP